MLIPKFAIAALAVALAAPLAQAEEQAAEPAAEGKRCIPIQRIKSTRVVDNQHIKFELTGGEVLMNTLPHKCPGLSRNDPFMYKTSLSQLCDLDTITVLQHIGGGFMPGATCGLGKFVPYVEEKKEDKDKDSDD